MGAVDIDVQEELGTRFNIARIPTLKIYDGKKFKNYNGERTYESFVETALAAMPKPTSTQTPLNDSSENGVDATFSSIDDSTTESNNATKVPSEIYNA